MVDASLRELRAAHRHLLAAHDDWLRASVKARETLRHGGFLPEDRRIDETFKRFMGATESFRLIVEKNRVDTPDLAITESSFASLSRSAEILSRSPPAAVTQAINRRPNAGGVAQLLAPFSGAPVVSLF